MKQLIFYIFLALTCTTAGQLQAAEKPASLQALFQRIPNLPDSIESATRWVDAANTLNAAAVLQLSADLEQQKQAVNLIANARNDAARASAMQQVDSLSQGMASAGIDMQRMQTDPAYAQQIQARMQKMSPQEMIAFSQQMNQPLQNNRNIPNEAQLLANDAPAVKQAAKAGADYSDHQVQRIQANEAIWQQTEAEIKRLQAKPLQVAASKPRNDWDDVSCDRACRAQWDIYTAQMVPLLEARANAILKLQQKALQRHRSALSDAIAAADRHMQATDFGSAAKSQANLARITGYDIAVVGDMEHLMTHLVSSVESAAQVKRCAKQMIRSPHAICQPEL